MAKSYVQLKDSEVEVLKKNGCRAEDWKKISAAAGFNPELVGGTYMTGEVKFGALSGKVKGADGVERPCGVFRTNLNNVTMGDNCCVMNVQGWISNVDIEDGVIIENVGKIICTGETSFGNGHEIAPFNEGGGREIKMTNETSSQIAYLTAVYRDRKEFISGMNKIADGYTNAFKRSRGFVGKEAQIMNADEIVNVYIAEYAQINGAKSLVNGTVNSCKESISFIGNGVVAEDFILQDGASVKDGAMIFTSLVGQGTKIGKQFSAENSVFFANCEGFHGEACSLFAGPYTVSHHRSTLLIAGIFSFFNAGSGTNQSNHMYKLGPIHQGTLERGSKTGSFSYLLWPSRVGAFTAVIGKHYANFDTVDLPFSYITEDAGTSIITPGMNYFTVGTMRDADKWPNRDRRKSPRKLDLLIFDVLSPFTMQKVVKAIDICGKLFEGAAKDERFVKYNGIMTNRLGLKASKRYYQLVLDKYMGDTIIKRFKKLNPSNIADILKAGTGSTVDAEWVDLSGLICSKDRSEKLIADVAAGKIADMKALHAALGTIFAGYEEDEWNFFLRTFKKINGTDITPAAVTKIMDAWKEASTKLVDMVLVDGSKEFEEKTRTGFGLDGNKDADFEAVRGTFETNKFIKKLQASKNDITADFDKIKAVTK
ncbi:MAG: DUF4954 family protein [bacterium]